MAEEPEDKQTLTEKLLFYTTASFILLATFSLFAFLFLVPFVIEPAFTTIFMEFDENPALCVTVETIKARGQKNCSAGVSCKEGCTKDVYECTRIMVDYKLLPSAESGEEDGAGRVARAIREDYDYEQPAVETELETEPEAEKKPSGLMPNGSEWYFLGAELRPNVKGCGYPPMLNCTIWNDKYQSLGTNFSCYYSRLDPSKVITDLDMRQVHLNLVYAMAIPIPSFIVSVIYLAIAYFYIYNEEEVVGGPGRADEATPLPLSTPIPPPTSGALTPASEVFREDLASFGHQLKVAMADDLSRESVFTDTLPVTSSNSINGNLNKMMTTSIITPPGPIAEV